MTIVADDSKERNAFVRLTLEAKRQNDLATGSIFGDLGARRKSDYSILSRQDLRPGQ